MKLGIDIYSLRSQGWNAFQHLEYARQIGLDVVHFSDLEPFDSLEPAYLRRVRRRADELGLSIEAGMGSICPGSVTFNGARGSAVAQLREMLGVAEILGSPVVRCFLGSNADRPHLKERQAEVVATCQAVRAECLDKGLTIAIENHAGDQQGRELRALIEAAGPDFVGACIDPGNAVWVAEDPLLTLEYLAPYVAASHARDSAVWPHPTGATVHWVAMGDGNVGIRAWAERYRALCPGKSFTMEVITGMAPKVLNTLEPAYWETYRETPAWEYARFEALVRAGQPFIGPMITVARGEMPKEYQAALVVQQRMDVERSVAWCKANGLGD
jgi:sugar phosphate isomerase/epimerase